MMTFSKYYYASLIIGAEQTTAVHYRAVDPGIGGGSLRVWHHNPALPSQPLTVSVTGTDIEVVLETDSGSNIISTPAHVATAVNADVAASALVVASPDGTMEAEGNLTYTYLAGGLATVTFETLSPLLGNRLSHDMRQAVARTEGGQIYVYEKSSGPTFKLELKLQHLTHDEAIALREFHAITVRGAMHTFTLEDWNDDIYEARFLSTELEFEEAAIDHYSVDFVLEVDGLPRLTT